MRAAAAVVSRRDGVVKRRYASHVRHIGSVHRIYESWYVADLPRIVADVDEGIEVDHRDVLPYSGHYRGREAYLDLLNRLVSDFPVLDIAPRDFTAGEGFVLVTGRYFGAGTSGLVDADFLHLWHLSDGRPVRLGTYRTVDEAWQAVDDYDLGD